MLCPNCHKETADGARFCRKCGNAIPAFPPPTGFALEPESGLYYRSVAGDDPETGAHGTWTTWFDAGTGEYRQTFCPLRKAPTGNRTAQGGRTSANRPGDSGRQKPGQWLLLPVIAVIAGLALAFFQAGGFVRFFDGDSVWLPDGIKIVELSADELPRFVPAEGTEVESNEDGDKEANEDGDKEANSAEETLEEDGGPSLSLQKTTYRRDEDMLVTVRGVPQEVLESNRAFVGQYLTGADKEDYYTRKFLTGEAELTFTGPRDPGDYELRLYGIDGGSLATTAFTLEEGDGERESESSSANTHWAALYADFLRAEDFAIEELYFVDGDGTLPTHVTEALYTAVAGINFYEIEGFDYPVMSFTELVELDGSPGALDSTPHEMIYLIKNGEVTYEKTEEEIAMLFSVNEISGMALINGEHLNGYNLSAGQIGEQGRQMVEDNFGYLYDWLDEQAGN